MKVIVIGAGIGGLSTAHSGEISDGLSLSCQAG